MLKKNLKSAKTAKKCQNRFTSITKFTEAKLQFSVGKCSVSNCIEGRVLQDIVVQV